MPSLSSNINLGSGSVSGLIKSAQSIATQEANFKDQQMADEYKLSAYTDSSFSKYQAYLNNRIKSLKAAGSLSDAQKALSLSMTLISANHSNISSSIARENISIMTGSSSDPQKLALIGTQFSRAEAIGDDTLAQQLMGQYYTLSQKIQYDQVTAANAAGALGKASATAGAQGQGDTVKQLKDDLKNFEASAVKGGEGQLNTDLAAYAKAKAPAFAALGVKISSQPNYWDVTSGIIGAIYNHRILQALAEYPVNPNTAQGYVQDAIEITNGSATYKTLGGYMNLQEIQQAAQDPAMMAYNGATGRYDKTKPIGYQYQTFTSYKVVNNQVVPEKYQALVPQFSGLVGDKARNQTYFLTPTQTAAMHQLNLNFSDSSKGKGNVGDGVTVQTTVNTPQWFKTLISGQQSSPDLNPSTVMYSDNQGSMIFAGQSTTGEGTNQKGPAFFTLMKDTAGKFGVFEHLADGSTIHAGSDFGFNWGASSLLVNASSMLQKQIQIHTQQIADAAKISLPKLSALPKITVPRVAAPAPHINIGGHPSNAVAPRTVSVQHPSVSPGVPRPSSLNVGANVQNANFNLQGPGPGSIRL